MSRFDEFWSLWPAGPRKVNKKGCLAKWKAKKLDEKADEIIRHVRWSVENNKQWKDAFVPMPSTYLNQERWEDGTYETRRARAKGPDAVPDKPAEPEMSRWAIFANRAMFHRAFMDPRRGFIPMEPDELANCLKVKREIVNAAEEAEANGNRWEDEDFKDLIYTAIEGALGIVSNETSQR